jgi:hypothetical protein
MMLRGVLVAAHSRAMFPVLGGISGSTSAILNMICDDALNDQQDTTEKQKERRLRLKGRSF